MPMYQARSQDVIFGRARGNIGRGAKPDFFHFWKGKHPFFPLFVPILWGQDRLLGAAAPPPCPP